MRILKDLWAHFLQVRIVKDLGARTRPGPVRSQESKVQGLASIFVCAEKFSSWIFIAQLLKIRKAVALMTRITLHVTTRHVERLGVLRIFFIKEKKAFEKNSEEGLRRIGAIGEEPNRKENLQAVRKKSQNPHP